MGTGLAAMGGLLLPSGMLRAQEGVTLDAVGDMVSMAAKPGPYRIGFSNGFSGNSWRAMAIAALETEEPAEVQAPDHHLGPMRVAGVAQHLHGVL